MLKSAAKVAEAMSLEVAEVFAAVPDAPRARLLQLRELIFTTAARLPEVGEVVETLKWGEPSYLTKNKSGTTIRIHWKSRTPDQCALYVHCQSNLVEQFRARHSGVLQFEGTRAVFFPVKGRFPTSALRDCVKTALTYHLARKGVGK